MELIPSVAMLASIVLLIHTAAQFSSSKITFRMFVSRKLLAVGGITGATAMIMRESAPGVLGIGVLLATSLIAAGSLLELFEKRRQQQAANRSI
jgi:hypothetical protein